MKVSVVMPRYAIAGVPLAQMRFARALADGGHDVDLVVGRIDADNDMPTVPGVNLIRLETPNVRAMMPPLWAYLRRARPEVIFSAEDHLTCAVLITAIAAGSRARISGSSRITPFDTYSSVRFSKRWFLKQLMRAVMWRADALTCVSQGMVEEYRRVFRNPPHVCVYNVIDNRHSRERMLEQVEDDAFIGGGDPLIVAAGRLAPWKGFADLIDAMKILGRTRRARLIILGDGPLREQLAERIAALGLSDRVRLEGYVQNPLKYFVRADVFVLSSHLEGMGNVLVEAMMCGCTPVATDCPTGPREVLGGGRYGYLVPVRDPAGLARGIEAALDRPIPRALLQEAIRPFEEATIIRRNFDVLGLPAGGTAVPA